MFVESHRLAQFNPRGTDVGVVLDLMIHDIDLILAFVHSPVRAVEANGVAVVSDTADIANARIPVRKRLRGERDREQDLPTEDEENAPVPEEWVHLDRFLGRHRRSVPARR